MPEIQRYIAPAKINLGLKVRGRRADGYHEIETIFYRVLEPHDSIVVTESDGFRFTCSDFALPIDNRNIMMRAAKLYTERAGYTLPNIHVHLEKRIPMGSGLGGGSSDAALMLRILQEHSSIVSPPNAIGGTIDAGSGIGADVPFFLSDSQAVFATGIGEMLTPMKIELACTVLIVIDPAIHISTPEAYQDLNRPLLDSTKELKPTPIILPKHLSEFRITLFNDFETTVFQRHPRLADIKESMYAMGASFALMSGSGSAIYGLFETMEVATHAKEQLAAEGLMTFLS